MKKYWYAILGYARFIYIKLFNTRNFSFTIANLIFPHCAFEFSSNASVKFGYKISKF